MSQRYSDVRYTSLKYNISYQYRTAVAFNVKYQPRYIYFTNPNYNTRDSDKQIMR
jgi:hypothetical protein